MVNVWPAFTIKLNCRQFEVTSQQPMTQRVTIYMYAKPDAFITVTRVFHLSPTQDSCGQDQKSAASPVGYVSYFRSIFPCLPRIFHLLPDVRRPHLRRGWPFRRGRISDSSHGLTVQNHGKMQTWLETTEAENESVSAAPKFATRCATGAC